MTTLLGYDGRFALLGWSADDGAPSHQESADDMEALRTRAEALIERGAVLYAELANWNFELNDWVRMETFGARTPRAEG